MHSAVIERRVVVDVELVSDRGEVRTRTVTPSTITPAQLSAEQQSAENSSSGFITPPSTLPSRPKMKHPKPSTFDPVGSDPEALESWLDQMDLDFILAETAETDKNEKVLTASFYLAGKARDWYRTEKAKLTSWAEFKKRMKSYFIPSNYRSVLVQQWDKLAWQKGQTAAQYSNEIKSLALKLDKSDEDKIHKLVFNGNPRFITQLVTQMGIADQAVATDATADKYDIIEKLPSILNKQLQSLTLPVLNANSFRAILKRFLPLLVPSIVLRRPRQPLKLTRVPQLRIVLLHLHQTVSWTLSLIFQILSLMVYPRPSISG